MGPSRQANLWIGPSGWSYPDWHGPVYPAFRARGFRPLAFVAQYFNAVEVNSSFYAIPSPRMTAAWPAQTPQPFRFTVKLWRGFTHETVVAPDTQAVAAFKAALGPLRDAQRLGPLLIQFPWSFHFGPPAVERLRRLADAFAEYERSIEVRHASWLNPEAWPHLTTAGGVCSIDQPRLHDCIGPEQRVLGPNGYVRLHGRNQQNWFADGIEPHERYNYLYSDDELREWVGRINAMMAQARDVYVFANNHYKGQGVANALALRAMLSGETVSVPANVLETYPALRRHAAPPRTPGLFD